MPSRSECLQITLNKQTPCFNALGSEPCNEYSCAVAAYLHEKNIDPLIPSTNEETITWALHWICPASNHNPKLSETERERLNRGLKASLQR